MGFFDFESESFEASGPAAKSASPSAGPPRPAGGGGSTTTAASAPTSGGGAAASSRPRPPAAPSNQGVRDSRTSTSPSSPSSADPSGGGGSFSFDRVAPLVKQGWGLARFGTKIARQFGKSPRARRQSPGATGQLPGVDGLATSGQPAGPGLQPAGDDQPGYSPQPSGYDVAGMPQPYGVGAPGQPASNLDQLGILLQALDQRQIPPLPGPSAQTPVAATPMAPGVPQADGMALLRLILTNPQFQQALQTTAVMGSAGPRTVQLPVPAPGPPHRMRRIPIPLGAVMNAITALAGQSMVELNESTREDDPEVPAYLVDEQGEFVVDPASPDDRAALVAHLFRVSDEAHRSHRFQPKGRVTEADDELSESDAWAREAGFRM